MKNVLTLAATVLFFTSCKKNDAPVTGPAVPVAKGVYVLSEGSFGGNNAKLAFWETSSTTLYPDFFLQQNPTQSAGLGDTGNDLLIYGSKLYIVMNNSANVTVLNAATGSFITRISFLNGSVNRNPRYAAAARGKVFVTSYDNSVSVIDTSSLSIVSSIAVGANPEHIIAREEKELTS